MKTVQPMTGAQEITLAVDQPEYESLICAVYHDTDFDCPMLLSRWKPSDEERERIAAGEDLYLAVLTCGDPMQPVMLTVGDKQWKVPPAEEVENAGS